MFRVVEPVGSVDLTVYLRCLEGSARSGWVRKGPSMSTTEEQPSQPEQSSEQKPPVDPELVRQLAQRAADEGVDLAGPGGLLQQLTKQVLETGLEVEMSEHLGYDRHEATGRDGENSRNGTRAKTVTTEVGPVELEVPRDREGSFEPKTVRKRQRRLHGVDVMVLSLAAKGLTTGEISAHLADVYGADVSRTRSRPSPTKWSRR